MWRYAARRNGIPTLVPSQVPSNHVIARIGARRILACSMCGWGVFSASTGLATSATSLYVLRRSRSATVWVLLCMSAAAHPAAAHWADS